MFARQLLVPQDDCEPILKIRILSLKKLCRSSELMKENLYRELKIWISCRFMHYVCSETVKVNKYTSSLYNVKEFLKDRGCINSYSDVHKTVYCSQPPLQ